MEKRDNILVSGVKPTAGQAHIGNYFGAMKQFVDLQDTFESYIFVANYHALTQIQDRELLEKSSRNIIADYIAIGLDPEKTTLYVQSDIPEVTELAWIFNCLVTVPYLQRAHAYKDAVAKGNDVNVGTFTYPILMAADILIQDANIVPVGSDQKQHVEIARDIAQKFNATYGDTFVLPEPHILEEGGVIPGIDGRKMSKSYGNTIPLFATHKEIEEAIMGIPTDSKGIDEPKDIDNDIVYQLHTIFTSGPDMERVRMGYIEGGLSYKDSKDILIKSIHTFIDPLREKRNAIQDNEIDSVIQQGAARVRDRAQKKLAEVRKKVGII